MREFVSSIVSGQLDNVDKALEEVHEKDPDKYLALLFKLMEFSLPKKTDLTSGDEAIKPGLGIIVDSKHTAEAIKKVIDEGSRH